MIPLRIMISGNQVRRADKKYVAFLFFSLIAVVLMSPQVCPPAYSDEGQIKEQTPEAILSFADHLFKEKDFYRAITEYKRLRFFYPQSPLSRQAGLKVGLAYLEGGKLGAALSAFEDAAAQNAEDEIMWQAIYYMGEAHYRSGDYDEAARLFSRVEAADVLPELKKEATLKKGWAYVRKGEWTVASATFRTVQGTDDNEPINRLASELTKVELPHKSPALAGTLSALLPGAGQLYVGRRQDAAVAFLLNAAFIAGAVDAFSKDEDAVGAILLFFEAGWYAGNIYSAVGSAHKYNRKQKNDYIHTLDRRYSIGITDKGDIMGLYNLRF